MNMDNDNTDRYDGPTPPPFNRPDRRDENPAGPAQPAELSSTKKILLGIVAGIPIGAVIVYITFMVLGPGTLMMHLYRNIGNEIDDAQEVEEVVYDDDYIPTASVFDPDAGVYELPRDEVSGPDRKPIDVVEFTMNSRSDFVRIPKEAIWVSRETIDLHDIEPDGDKIEITSGHFRLSYTIDELKEAAGDGERRLPMKLKMHYGKEEVDFFVTDMLITASTDRKLYDTFFAGYVFSSK